jgi:hypothetical protein
MVSGQAAFIQSKGATMQELIWGLVKEHPIITAFALFPLLSWMADTARNLAGAREFLKGPDPFLMDEEEYEDFNRERFSPEEV